MRRKGGSLQFADCHRAFVERFILTFYWIKDCTMVSCYRIDKLTVIFLQEKIYNLIVLAIALVFPMLIHALLRVVVVLSKVLIHIDG
jgi:hypothetical protein